MFGVEGNWPETLAINDYVLSGRGDLDAALSQQGLWRQTAEVRDLIVWMRRYNQDPSHVRKLKFVGFDMQTPGLAEANVLDYLARVDAGYRESAARVFSILGEPPENPDYERAAPQLKQRVTASLAEALQRFDERKDEYVRRSSAEEWAMARQNLVIVNQAAVKLGGQSDAGKAFRDRAMADNVKWILDQEPSGTRMMLWAHNGHVASQYFMHTPMGAYLRQLFGSEFVNFGFVFAKGSFRAMDMTTNQDSVFTVDDPPAGSLDATLASIGMPVFATDLRTLPPGPIKEWFDGTRRSRQIGGGYSTKTPGVWIQPMRPVRAFDFLIFVGKTTPSAPL